MSTSTDDRAARLKAALRDNLRRRKAQARGRSEEAEPDSKPARAGSAPPLTAERDQSGA